MACPNKQCFKILFAEKRGDNFCDGHTDGQTDRWIDRQTQSLPLSPLKLGYNDKFTFSVYNAPIFVRLNKTYNLTLPI